MQRVEFIQEISRYNENILEDIQADLDSELAKSYQKKEEFNEKESNAPQATASHNGVLSLNGSRLHPDLDPVFTGSRVTSYTLRMPSYSKEFTLLARSDVERYQILTKPP